MNFIKPKKSLGQHFLTDKNIAKKIIESLKPKTKNVLEIGPSRVDKIDFLHLVLLGFHFVFIITLKKLIY